MKRPTEIDYINGFCRRVGKEIRHSNTGQPDAVTWVKGIEKYLLEYEPDLKRRRINMASYLEHMAIRVRDLDCISAFLKKYLE